MKKYKHIFNKSKTYYTGSEWESKSCGKFTIVGKVNKFKYVKTKRGNLTKSYIYFFCKFMDNTIVIAEMTNIKIGNIRNPNYPVVCGVGYIGQGKYRSTENRKSTKEYAIWLHMMSRCYSSKFHRDYPSYIGVTVCDRWHNFQNFCKDIQKLTGYINWKCNSGYVLDKDVLCEKLGIIPKVYSPETCIFITFSENTSESTSRKNLTGLTYIGISPDNITYEFINIHKFSNEHELCRSCVYNCITGKQISPYKGWRFKIKDSL